MFGIQSIRRVSPLLAAAAIAFTAGCGTVQPFSPAPGHLQTVNSDNSVPPLVTHLPSPPPPVARPPQNTYSVVVTEVPVRDVLFALARDASVNIDVNDGIEGKVTINAINQTLPQILDRISRQVAIRYQLNDGTLTVMPDSPYWQNYHVDYVNLARSSEGEVTVATQIATAGGSVGGQGGAAGAAGVSGGGGAADAEGNGSNTRVKSLNDNAFWPLLAANLRHLLGAPDEGAQQAQGAPGAAPADGAGANDPVVANPIAGVVSVRGTSVQQRLVQAFLDQITANAKRQVLIEVTVVEVDLNDQYQAGVDWSKVSSNGGLGKDGVSLISGLTGSNLGTPPVFTMKYNNFDADGSGFAATIRMLSQFGNTKVLSTPRIMALNNQTALLKVVDERVYFTLTAETVESTGPGIAPRTIVTSEINTVPVGFVMSVTPQINRNGNVSLNVRPTLTRILGYVPDPAPRLQGSDFDNLVPELHVSEIESLLEVANGQTVVIGGLMQDRSSKGRDGIPGLSRLPLIGDLFSYRNDQITKSELVLFLRPTVIQGAGSGQPSLASAAAPLNGPGKALP